MVFQREIPDEPSWLDLLFDASTAPGALHPTIRFRWSDQDLPLEPIVSEVVAWWCDNRPYEAIHRPAWQSVIKDLEAAVALAGPKLRHALGPTLIPLLSLSNGGLQSGRPAAESLPAGLAAANALQARMGDETVLAAAWNDVVDACRDPDVDFTVIAARRDEFWHQVAASGRNQWDLGSQICEILSDDAAAVTRTEPDAHTPTGRCAGLDKAQRIELATQTLTAPSRPAHHVVWFAFDQARLPTPAMTMNGIELLRSTAASTMGFPELATLDSALPMSADTVLARIDLGLRTVRNAVVEAERQVDALVALAKVIRRTELGWVRRAGHRHAIDGRFLRFAGIAAAGPSGHDELHLDAMSASLGELAAHPAAVIDAAPLLDLLTKVGPSSPDNAETAVILNVRGLEYVAAQVEHTTWQRYAQRHLRTHWVKDRIFDETHTAIFQAVHPPYQSPSVFDWNQLEAVSSRVSIPGPPGSGWARIDYGAALDELDTLLTIHPAYTYAGRQLASVHNRIASMDSLTSWMRRLEDEFDLRLNRLVRVRNALTHGGPTTAAIVQSAQRFSAPLSLRALNTTLQAILAGEDPAAYHAEARERAESWRRDLPLSSVRNALLGDG